MTERTMLIAITRDGSRRTVDIVFQDGAENITLAGDVNNPNDKDKFEELASIVPGLHALDNNASQAGKQQKGSDSSEFAVPDDTLSALRRFRLRYSNPS